MAKFFPINTPLINYFFYPAPLPGNLGANQPIAGGKLFFFEDEDHNIKLPTYSDVFDPQNPVVNTNPIVLGDAGQWPLFYLENRFYFIVLTGPEGDINTPIETFSHYNPARLQGLVETVQNYIPNGQFWAHNFDEREVATGTVSVNIAPGGWFFGRIADDSTDFISFEREAEYTENPSGNPRYSVRTRTTMVGPLPNRKEVAIGWQNVNLFASVLQQYTFGINAKNNNSGTIQLQVFLRKFYGTGGSPNEETLLVTFDVSGTTPQFLTHSFVFGDNLGKTIGPNDDDFVALQFRWPGNATYDAQLTDFMLVFGDIDLQFYPPTPIAEDQYTAEAGSLPLPNPDGSDLLLPIRQGLNGFEYDDSGVGHIDAILTEPGKGELLCDGSSFFTDERSDIGIPFSRLQKKLAFRGGMGLDFVTANVEANRMILPLNQHENPLPAAPVDVDSVWDLPAPPNAFDVHTSIFNLELLVGLNQIDPGDVRMAIVSKLFGAPLADVFGNVSANVEMTTLSGNLLQNAINDPTGQSSQGYRLKINTPLSGAGGYFNISTLVNPLAPASQQWHIWIQVDGVGVQPAGPGLGVKVNRNSLDSQLFYAIKIAYALNSFAVYEIPFKAGIDITANAHWTFDTSAQNYLVWYDKGGGTAPGVPGRKPIKVTIGDGNTAAQVATASALAINNFKFAVPNLQGQFLRGYDPTQIYDPESHRRFFIHQQNFPSRDLGTLQWPIIQSHGHQLVNNISNNEYQQIALTLGGPSGAVGIQESIGNPQVFADHTGLKDTRPWNMAVNFVIKY